MISAPIQASATGGSFAVVATGLLLQAATVPLAILVAYRLFVGYRGSGDRAMLSLAVGLILLVAVPTVVRFVVPTVLGPGGVTGVVQELGSVTSELLGLAAIIYAIYGRSSRRRTVRKRYEPEPKAVAVPILLVAAAFLATEASGLPPGFTLETLAQLTSIPPALIGGYVAAVAFRGYRRNDSAPMAFLSAGIGLVTTVRVSAQFALLWTLDAPDVTILFVNAGCYLLGLLAVYYSLTRA